MISAALGTVVLAAVLSAFLFIGRTSMSIRQYSDMETEARNAIETFAQDVRMASDVVWHSRSSLTLTAIESGTETKYRYSYDSTAGTFSRQKTSPSTGPSNVLITGITSLVFSAYKIDTQEINLSSITAATHLETKQIQISLEAQRARTTLATGTNTVVSARFILRNKHVT